MAQAFHLKPLQELTRSKLDAVTRELGHLIAHEQNGAQQLEHLQSYRAEYELRLREALDAGIGVEAYRNYNAFLTRIDQAIDIQRKKLDLLRHNTLAGQQAWVQHRNRNQAFDALHQRHLTTQARLESKQEQAFSDEHATRRVWLCAQTKPD